MPKKTEGRPPRNRPYPPDMGERLFVPAREVLAWIGAQLIAEDGALHNPDHAHLADADLEVLWASGGYEKAGRTVAGTAELVQFRAGGWQRARQEEQMVDWFGRVPKWLITLDAAHSAQCSDAAWCALVEHELYHIAQALDDFGAPRFNKDGQPVLMLQAHDVEEFVGVVRRYGAIGANVQRMVEAANAGPEVGLAGLAAACGTCLRRVA